MGKTEGTASPRRHEARNTPLAPYRLCSRLRSRSHVPALGLMIRHSSSSREAMAHTGPAACRVTAADAAAGKSVLAVPLPPPARLGADAIRQSARGSKRSSSLAATRTHWGEDARMNRSARFPPAVGVGLAYAASRRASFRRAQPGGVSRHAGALCKASAAGHDVTNHEPTAGSHRASASMPSVSPW
jgi:hypothetical protein